jgi:hypothetical protein
MKYIVVQPKAFVDGVTRPKFPVLFPDHLCHCDMVPKDYEAISAGFVSLRRGSVACYSKSDSLKVHSHKNTDEFLIDSILVFGEAMLFVYAETYDDKFRRDELALAKAKAK